MLPIVFVDSNGLIDAARNTSARPALTRLVKISFFTDMMKLLPRVLEIYPVVLVPLFLGPPLGILTHIFSFRNLAAAKARSRS